MKFKVSPAEAKKKLEEENEFPFIAVMKHGSMTMEYFAPVKADTQTPHKQDEIYVIIKGDAIFFRDGEMVACKKGDILLYLPVWNIVLKTLALILRSGLFSMEWMEVKIYK